MHQMLVGATSLPVGSLHEDAARELVTRSPKAKLRYAPRGTPLCNRVSCMHAYIMHTHSMYSHNAVSFPPLVAQLLHARSLRLREQPHRRQKPGARTSR